MDIKDLEDKATRLNHFYNWLCKKKSVPYKIFAVVAIFIFVALAYLHSTGSYIVSRSKGEWVINWPLSLLAFLELLLAVYLWFYRGLGGAKLTVYVVLPACSNHKDPTRGDNLLQMAGFLSAQKAFGDRVKIEWRAHMNSEDKASEILHQAIDNTPKGQQICIVFTMSRICKRVCREAKLIVKNNKSIAKRLSIIFTVASDHSLAVKKHVNGAYLFQHFVRGDYEVDAIIHRYFPSKKKASKEEYLLLVMDSDYPKEAAQYLSQKVVLDKYNIRLIYVNSRGDPLTNEEAIELEDAANKGSKEQVAVGIGYDQALFGMPVHLNKHGFEGIFVGTTPLSVRDWQEYIKREESLLPDKFEMFYTNVRGFDAKAQETRYFANKLEDCNFKSVTKKYSEKYKYNLDDVRGAFDEIEEKVYEHIYPNYISAFCFDSIRLFDLMHEQGKQRLSDVDLHKHATENHCPFLKLRFDPDGWTDVELEIKKFDKCS